MRLDGSDLLGEYPDRTEALELLRGLAECGINLVDTAGMYGPHMNEKLIHDALAPYDGVGVATNGGCVRGGRDLSTIASIGNYDSRHILVPVPAGSVKLT